jgi:mercuric ion binding protein
MPTPWPFGPIFVCSDIIIGTMRTVQLIAIMMFLACQGAWAMAAPPADTLVVHTRFYCDHCNECGSCRPFLERELQFTKGVKHLGFDIATHTITIGYDARKTDPATLRKVIAALGFDADDVHRDATGHKKLDACCQRP